MDTIAYFMIGAYVLFAAGCMVAPLTQVDETPKPDPIKEARLECYYLMMKATYRAVGSWDKKANRAANRAWEVVLTKEETDQIAGHLKVGVKFGHCLYLYTNGIDWCGLEFVHTSRKINEQGGLVFTVQSKELPSYTAQRPRTTIVTEVLAPAVISAQAVVELADDIVDILNPFSDD